jgi:hypothetical protein
MGTVPNGLRHRFKIVTRMKSKSPPMLKSMMVSAP